MTSQPQTERDRATNPNAAPEPEATQTDEPILCPHCRRTATNGKKCKGICVADSNY